MILASDITLELDNMREIESIRANIADLENQSRELGDKLFELVSSYDEFCNDTDYMFEDYASWEQINDYFHADYAYIATRLHDIADLYNAAMQRLALLS